MIVDKNHELAKYLHKVKGVPVPVDEYVSRFVELEFPITSQFCEIKTSPFHLNLEYLDNWPLHVWSEVSRYLHRAS